MFQAVYHRIIICRQIDEQGGNLYAKLCGEVYGYQSSCTKASGDAESWTVDRALYISHPLLQWLLGAAKHRQTWA